MNPGHILSSLNEPTDAAAPTAIRVAAQRAISPLGPIAQRRPFLLPTDLAANAFLRKLEGTERLTLIRGKKKILPGIELIIAPGHTPGLQVTAVNTAKGTASVGSDVAHTFFSYETDIPSAYIIDMVSWMKSYDKVRAKASSSDLLFPGHDTKMTENFPQVAKDISRLA